MIQNWLEKSVIMRIRYATNRLKTLWIGDKNYLYLNVPKTKEMCIDFGKNQRCPKPVYVKGEAVEKIETYKYMGVVFDSKLNLKENINSVLKKVNTRMYCLRKLRSFGVNSGMLVTFYNAVICIIIVYGSVCWGGNISKFDRGRLEKIVQKKQVVLWECHWTVLRHSMKNDCSKN